MSSLPTIEEISSLVRYEDGSLYWRVNRRFAKAGDEVTGTYADGYGRLFFKGRGYAAHRVIWLLKTGEWPERFLDHIDGNRSNNRIENLRACDSLTNTWNKGPKAGKRFKGVVLHRQLNKYQAQIKVRGKALYLGVFEKEEDAARAYDRAAEIHFGGFARLNFGSQA